MAFEKLEPSQELVDNTLKDFEGMARFGGKYAVRDLLPYTEIDDPPFTRDGLERYRKIKAQEAAEKWLEERMSGQKNDKESKKPGFTALVKPGAKGRIEHVLGLTDTSIDTSYFRFKSVEGTEGEKQLYLLELPFGGYREHGDSMIEFVDLVEQVGDYSVRPAVVGSTSARALRDDVVTIIGEGGTYWQNSGLNLDGTHI